MCGIQAGFDGKSLLPLNFRSLSGASPTQPPASPSHPSHPSLSCPTGTPGQKQPQHSWARRAGAAPGPAPGLFHPGAPAAPLSRPGALSLSPRPRPDSPACPARALAPRSFLSSRRGAPGPAAPVVRGPQHLPWGPPPSAPCGPGGSQASCSPPTSSPVPGQTTFPCTCNPITNCPVSPGVIPPRAHPLSQPDSYLDGEDPGTLGGVSSHGSQPRDGRHAWAGGTGPGGVNPVTAAHPFRTEYKYSYLTPVTQRGLLSAFRTKHQMANGKEVETNANRSPIRPRFQGL